MIKLTKEQEEAIERLKYIDRYYDCNNYYSRYDLDCIETVLNLIQEQQEKIEKTKEEKDNWKKSYYKLKEETSKIANEINR